MPTIPDAITAEYPLLALFVILVFAFFMFVKWILSWQEKRETKWQGFLAEQAEKSQSRDEKLATVLDAGFRQVLGRIDNHEEKVIGALKEKRRL